MSKINTDIPNLTSKTKHNIAAGQIEIKRKVVDAAAYISAIRELVQEGHDVSMIITGSSMNPFLIHGRDSIMISKPNRPLKKGDMVFYQRDNEKFVMHRICKVKESLKGDICFDIIGDAQTEVEKDVRDDQIFGLITKVCRKGRWIEPGDFWWIFFEKIWLHMIPIRRIVMRLYSLVTR